MDNAILLVEDEDADAALVTRAIKKLTFKARVLHVNDVDAARNYLQGNNSYADRTVYPIPVLILLDIKLPGVSGFELVEWLRKQPAPLCRVAVVMLTSSAQQGDINRAYEVGANSYLRKPDRHAQLVALLDSFNDYWLTRSALPEVLPGLPNNA